MGIISSFKFRIDLVIITVTSSPGGKSILVRTKADDPNIFKVRINRALSKTSSVLFSVLNKQFYDPTKGDWWLWESLMFQDQFRYIRFTENCFWVRKNPDPNGRRRHKLFPQTIVDGTHCVQTIGKQGSKLATLDGMGWRSLYISWYFICNMSANDIGCSDNTVRYDTNEPWGRNDKASCLYFQLVCKGIN